MIHSKINVILIITLFLSSSCAVNPLKHPQAQQIFGEKGVHSGNEKDLLERLKSLEESISKLSSEIKILEGYLKSLKIRPPISTYKLPQEVFLCGERIPLEDRNIWENLDREFLISLGNEAQVLLWMKRSRRYFPYIEEKLKDMGLPDDLKYITIVESTLRPEAVSISGAGGIWQFIPSTGEIYGMRKTKGLDERFDFFKATEGALMYLKKLYDEFQSWILAMAAYNAGENRIRKEIDSQRTRNYFYLDLPIETERYIYKIAVAKIILSNPKNYGFYIDENDYYAPLNVERIKIELSNPLPIIEVSKALGYYYKEIKELNPHFQEEAIPPGIHFINIPFGTSKKFWEFLSSWNKASQNP
jgi:hypothetical protein